MNKLITCEECNTDFELNLHTERLSDGIEHNFLKCTECGKKYTSFYTDTNIRTRQKKVQGMWERFHSTKNPLKREAINEKIKKEQEQVSIAIEKLNAMFSRQ